MQQVDSGVLVGLNALLRATGGEQDVTFDDGNLQQVLDVAPVIRRSGAPFGQERGGVFVIKLANTHGGAGALTATLDVYDQLDTKLGFRAPHDVWLLAAHIVTTTNTAYTSKPLLDISVAPQPNFLPSMDANVNSLVAIWATAKQTLASSAVIFFGNDAADMPLRPQRLPRGATLRFHTNAAGAESNTVFIRIAILPQGLGQDAVGEG